MIDPGSDLHLAQSSLYVQLGAPPIRLEKTRFNGVGAINQSTIGRFTADILINDLTFILEIDVVPDNFTGHDLILGGELSDLAEVCIRKRQATLSKLGRDDTKTIVCREDRNTNWAEILCVNVDNDEDVDAKHEVPLHHILDPDLRQDVRRIVKDYHPMKTKDSGVKM